MTHEDVREAVALDERDPAVEEHLRTCTDCAAFARNVARVTAAAPSLAPALPPAALADTVVAAVRGSGRRSLAGRVGWRAPLATAAAVAVLGAATLVATGGREEQPVLVAAAERTEEAKGAQVRVAVEVDVEVARPTVGAPSYVGLPPEVSTYLDTQVDRMMADFERRMADWQRQVDAFVRDALPGNPAMPWAPGSPRLPRPPIPTGRIPFPQPKAPPEKLTMGVDVTLDGSVDFEGRTRLRGSVKAESGTVSAPGTSATVDIAVDGTNGVVRGLGGAWSALGGAEGPLGSVLLDGGALPQLLRAGASVDAAPGATYRYPVTGLAGPDVRSEVEVQLDAEGRAARVTVTSAGSAAGTRWRTHVDVRVLGYGGVEIGPMPAATGAGVDVSSFIYPFGPSVAVALGVDR